LDGLLEAARGGGVGLGVDVDAGDELSVDADGAGPFRK
jgi:hypothetical protein